MFNEVMVYGAKEKKSFSSLVVEFFFVFFLSSRIFLMSCIHKNTKILNNTFCIWRKKTRDHNK